MALDLDLSRQRAALWIVAAALLAVLAYVAWSFVGTLIFGVFVYYATRPIYERLWLVIPSRSLAAAVAILLVFLPALLLFGWALAVAIQELLKLARSETFDQYQALLEPYLDYSMLYAQVREQVEVIRQSGFDTGNLDVAGLLETTLNQVLGWLGLAGSVVLHLFVVLIVAFYLLRDDHRFAAWARSFVDEDGVVDEYVRAVDADLKTVYFGNILNAFLTGIIGAVTYNALNTVAPPEVAIPAPTLIGLLTGAASLIPVVGIKIAYVPVLGYLLAASAVSAPRTAWFAGLFLAVSIVIVDVIPDLVLRPYVSGKTLHIGAVMLAYIFGPLLFGWYGLFLGPFLLVLVVEFGRIVVPWLADPGTVPPTDGAFVAERDRAAPIAPIRKRATSVRSENDESAEQNE